MEQNVPTLWITTSLVRPAAKSGSKFVTLEENALWLYASDIALDDNSELNTCESIIYDACWWGVFLCKCSNTMLHACVFSVGTRHFI